MSHHYLCISVTFLDSLFHGKGDENAEWPPSPMRLFQALLKGARTGCRGASWDDARADAFCRLGKCPPPLIIAPPVRRATRYTLFVPNNDSDKRFDRQDRLTSKIAWPYRLLNGSAVHFVWPLEDDAAEQSWTEILCREARNLFALGWGVDQVVGIGRVLPSMEVTTLCGVRWRAWAKRGPAVPTWRVPTADSLRDLEHVHQSFVQRLEGKRYRPPLKVSQFDTVEYLNGMTLPPRSYAAFELAENIAFRQGSAAAVAAMTRSLASRAAKADNHEFPNGSEVYVAGHIGKKGKSPPLRFSYLALPTIGHAHADGLIRRVIVVEPFGGDGRHAQWAQDRLRNAALRDESGENLGVLLGPWRRSSASMLRRYVGEGRTWCSVTPVILPGFDDRKHAKAEKLLLAALRQAELPLDLVAELAIRKAPFWPAVQHARHYAVPEYLRHLPAWHVYFRFHDCLAGPLSIGAGRHCGLGVFARLEEGEDLL